MTQFRIYNYCHHHFRICIQCYICSAVVEFELRIEMGVLFSLKYLSEFSVFLNVLYDDDDQVSLIECRSSNIIIFSEIKQKN
jgi:hypothetical protein